MQNVRLRPGRPHEAELLSDLCIRSKAVWGYDENFLNACRDELTLGAEEIASDLLQVAEIGGRVVGVAQVSLAGAAANLEKLFVEPDCIGGGVGAALFEWARRAALAKGAVTMLIEADPGAAPFYERMGAVVVGEVKSGSIPGRMLPLLRIGLDSAQ